MPTPTDSLILSVGFNSLPVEDLGPNGIVLAKVGAPSVLPGVVGNAISLNGVDQYLKSSDPRLRIGVGAMGFSVWVRLATLAHDSVVFSMWGVSDADKAYRLFYSAFNDQFRFGRADAFNNTTGQVVIFSESGPLHPSVGVWYNLQGWFDPSDPSGYGSLNGSVGGTCIRSGAQVHLMVPPATPTAEFRVGAYNISGSEDFFEGDIDALQLYSRTLSIAECPTFYAGIEPSVSGIADRDCTDLSLRVHQQAKTQVNVAELYYFRESAWHLFPIQPSFSKDKPLQISKSYRQPSTLTFTIPDNQGLLNRRNKNSSYNYQSDTTTFDPVLKAKRKIRLRTGKTPYDNLSSGILPTSSLAPSSGSLASLTDTVLGDIIAGSTGFVQFAPTDDTPIEITIDTGIVQLVQHFVARFATKNGVCKLPAFVNWGWSTDESTWHYTAHARPLGGPGGDWDDDGGAGAQTIEAVRTDIEVYARYVRFTVTPVGAQTIFIDEVAVFGGSRQQAIGGNYFTGYLGGSTRPNPDGTVDVTATDVLKKMLDNNSTRLTAQFGGGAGPIDAADILYSLNTSTAIWKGAAGAYDEPFSSEEIGWAFGANAANFKYPVWQGQSNNIYGYEAEILHTIGFDLQPDGSGVLELFEPPYRQVLPDRLFIADDDGNNDCWGLTPLDDDVNLRNKTIVRSGDPKSGATSTVKIVPSSIADFGELVTEIDDPIALDQQTREKIASYFLRDYAFNQGTITGKVRMDCSVKIKRVIAFRATRRMSLYANDYDASEDIRAQSLWIIDQIDESISIGDWSADLKCSEYQGLGPNPPLNLTATPRFGDDTIIDLTWDEPSDTDITDYRLYYSTDGEDGDYTYLSSALLLAGTTTFAFGAVTPPVTPGQQYWFYLTSRGQNGVESEPSSVVTAIAGAEAGDDSFWTVTDLSADLTEVVPPVDANGLYGYTISLAWISPPVGASSFQQDNYGFKHGEFRFAVDAIPANPLSPDSWIFQDEWHGDRVPSLLTWDRVTAANLAWPLRFNSPTNLTGKTIYIRIFTWFTTNGFHGPAHASNIASVVIP